MISLRTKTVVGVALIEASLLALLIFTAIDFMEESENENIIKRATTTAQLFATTTKDAVLSYDIASLEIFVNELLSNPDIEYVKVLSSENKIFASGGDPKALKRPFSEDINIYSVNDNTYDVSSLIKEADVTYGRIELGISTSSIDLAMANVRNWTISIALLEMTLVALFSLFLGVYLTINLKKLQHAAISTSQAISDGSFAYTNVNIQSKDEIGLVAKAFNQLSLTLQDENQRREAVETDLKELNAQLDEKVKKRTLLLESKNDELQKTNQSLKSTQEQLVQSEKMASIGQLAAGVAHEINNPLGYINSNLGTLTEYVQSINRLIEIITTYTDDPSDDHRDQLISDIISIDNEEDLNFLLEDTNKILVDSIEGLNRITEIVKSLKQFSRASSNDVEQASLNDCVKTTIKMTQNTLKYHCIVNTQLADLPETPMNVGKIIQVITNILVNSGQAIEGHGRILIQTLEKEQDVVLIIKDNGKGIPKENLSKLFNPFFTTKPVGEGTGLGLSISYDIIKEHGGSIQVKSEMGRGTIFIIRLPKTATQSISFPTQKAS